VKRSKARGGCILPATVGRTDPGKEKMFGPMGPTIKTNEVLLPVLRVDAEKRDSWLQPVPQRPMTFRTVGQSEDMTLSPLYKILDQRYTVYWRVQPKA
jgi:hypothetical protein